MTSLSWHVPSLNNYRSYNFCIFKIWSRFEFDSDRIAIIDQISEKFGRPCSLTILLRVFWLYHRVCLATQTQVTVLYEACTYVFILGVGVGVVEIRRAVLSSPPRHRRFNYTTVSCNLTCRSFVRSPIRLAMQPHTRMRSARQIYGRRWRSAHVVDLNPQSFRFQSITRPVTSCNNNNNDNNNSRQ